nr:aminotransferase class V-fold PLP-dependent enzyme [Saprospiraceae bacterium]
MDELVNKIKKLQGDSQSLDPDASTRGQLLGEVVKYTDRFLSEIDESPGYIAEDFSKNLENYKVGEKGENLEKLLALFEEYVEKPGINPASGGHLGYIPGGGLYTSAVGDFLAAVTNKYAGVYFGSPGAVRMEHMMVDWLIEILGFPKGAVGNLTSGGSIATLTAVTVARDAHSISGAGVSKAVIYHTSQVHHCLHKAIRIAGLGDAIHRNIQTDSEYKMPLDQLEEFIAEDRKKGLNPFLVVSTAGTTDSGVVDPLAGISDICKKYQLWHHVDAAYGGFFILVEGLKDYFKGIAECDSIAIDPHKGLFLPYGTGAVIIKDVDALLKSHHYQANYMRDAYTGKSVLSPADISPELTRHFRGLRMWLPLKLIGLDSFRKALEEKHLLALYFYEKIGEMGFETGGKPELSIVLYRYTQGIEPHRIDEFNTELIKACHRDGRVFLSSTTLKGRVWLRCAVLSFRTHLSTIDKALEMLSEALEEVKGLK